MICNSYLGYIDPGTGSMLLTIILSVATALVFIFRGVFIKLKVRIQGGNVKDYHNKLPYVIFSDHKRYWNVFEPVCDEMENRGLECHYLTASPDDPALTKDYQYVKAEFIGEGNKCFARLNMMKAYICLSTTPGLDVLQWKRSKDVNYYVNIFHSLDDGTWYRMFGLDHYDAVLLTGGEAQEKPLRKLEELRHAKRKEMVTVGCTFMDTMLERGRQLTAEQKKDPSGQKRILLAPSWGPSSILNRFGERFIDALVSTGYQIIIRPHPQSKISEAELLSRLQQRFPDSDHLEWNFDNDNFKVLSTADLLISDFSAVVFDYCYTFDRPIIYADTHIDNSPYDASWLEDYTPWGLAALERIGKQIREEDFDHMKSVIDDVLTNDLYKQGREESRGEIWHYIGESRIRTVDYLENKLQELQTAES